MSIFVPDSTRSAHSFEEHVERVLRRLLLWSVICIISAIPSFIWAASGFHRGAMAFGVALFIIAYTAATSTSIFERFHDRPHIRTTLYVGYFARLGLSVVFPLGMALDLISGLVSV